MVQRFQRADEDSAYIVVVRKNREQQDSQHHTQRQDQKLVYLLVDHVHGDVHAGQGHRRTGAVGDGHISRGQVAVLHVIGDEDRLLRVYGKSLVHQLIAAAVVSVGIPQVADAVLTGDAGIPDVVHHLILRHDHVEVLQAHLLLGVLQVAVDLVVIIVLLPGQIILLHLVSVDKRRRHRGLSEGELGILLLHSRPVQLGDGGCQYGRKNGGHDHQAQQQLGL